MTKAHLIGATAAILATSTLGSYAQDGGAGQGGSNQQSNDPLALTCAELRTMDTATVPGVLYFVSGYSAGQQGAAGAGAMSSETGAGGADAGTSDSGGAAQDGSQSDTSDSESASTGSDSGGSDMAATEDGNADGGSVEIGRITGYFNIPVEQVTIACDAEPDRPVSELLGEESRRQGASGAGDDANQGKEAAAEAQTGADAENGDAETSGSGGSSQ